MKQQQRESCGGPIGCTGPKQPSPGQKHGHLCLVERYHNRPRKPHQSSSPTKYRMGDSNEDMIENMGFPSSHFATLALPAATRTSPNPQVAVETSMQAPLAMLELEADAHIPQPGVSKHSQLFDSCEHCHSVVMFLARLQARHGPTDCRLGCAMNNVEYSSCWSDGLSIAQYSYMYRQQVSPIWLYCKIVYKTILHRLL